MIKLKLKSCYILINYNIYGIKAEILNINYFENFAINLYGKRQHKNFSHCKFGPSINKQLDSDVSTEN